jgi:hypothetical protein
MGVSLGVVADWAGFCSLLYRDCASFYLPTWCNHGLDRALSTICVWRGEINAYLRQSMN